MEGRSRPGKVDAAELTVALAVRIEHHVVDGELQDWAKRDKDKQRLA